MKADTECLAHGFEGGKEIAASIDYDQAAHPELEEELLEENSG